MCLLYINVRNLYNMKEQFLKDVDKVLIGYGFNNKSEGDNWEYVRTQTFTQPGQHGC